MRLIDADQLIKDGWHLRRSGRSNKTLSTMSIADVPTAYDVEEKLQRLEELAKEHPYKVIGEPITYGYYNEAWSDCSDRAIDIVKGGTV